MTPSNITNKFQVTEVSLYYPEIKPESQYAPNMA